MPKVFSKLNVQILFFGCIIVSILIYLSGGFEKQNPSPKVIKHQKQEGFVEIANDLGINHTYNHRRGAGLAIFDYNNDYLEDIIFAHPVKNKLYKNNGDGTFSEVAQKAGIAQPDGIQCIGVITADFNNDGHEDVFFSTELNDPQMLYLNLGDGTFKDITQESGLNFSNGPLRAKSATVGDVNLDGYLDIYLGTTVKTRKFRRKSTNTKNPKNGVVIDCFPDQLFINNGRLFFEEKSVEYQAVNHGCGFSPVFSDPDNDGDLDLMIPNDWGIENIPSRFLRNEYPQKAFTDVSKVSGFDQTVWGMGLAIGDSDQDGDLDYYETNIGENKFFENLGNGTFKENAKQKGVADKWIDEEAKQYISAGWGTHFLDFDNDTYLDLLVANSKLKGFDLLNPKYFGGPLIDSMPSKLFQNQGNGTFTDVSLDFGLVESDNSMSTVCLDYENDGDLDILFANTKYKKKHKGKPTFFRNQLPSENNWLRVKLVGTTTNRNAIGSHLTIYLKDKSWIHELTSGGSGQLSQSSRIAHFGLGNVSTVDSLVIDWLGPDNENTVMYNIPANQLILATQGQKKYQAITCFNGVKDGDETDVDCGGSCKICECSQIYKDTCFKKDICYYASLCFEEININEKSIVRQWNEILLNAIRTDFARPTVHARNLFHFSVAMYDIWALFDPKAEPYLIGKKRQGFQSSLSTLPDYDNKGEALRTAISYAAFRLLKHRFKNSPGAFQSHRDFNGMMSHLGYDKENHNLDYSSGDPAALGNFIASELIKYGLQDGAKEKNKYKNQYYSSVNKPLRMDKRGNPVLQNKNRWQPLTLETFVDQAGNEIPNNTPDFLGPEWGNVLPFALNEAELSVHQRDGNIFKVYHNPKMPPPKMNTHEVELIENEYKWGFALVPIWASHLSSADTTMLDISPASIGNIASLPQNFSEMRDFYNFFQGGDASKGHKTNPHTGIPYEPQMVKRGDYARVLAEFWADGPDSETPPGHWFTLLNKVSDHSACQKRFEGKGKRLDDLEWDVKSYFLLSGALHDSAISAWSIKGWHDYIRPVSAFRYMAEKGQCTDPRLPNYSKEGLPLIKGYIEQIQPSDSDFKDHKDVGKIKVYTWKGPDFIKYSTTDEAGVGWILAEKWWPYQRPSFVTPPFAGYVSGHSTFSRAAAEVLTQLTGSVFFPGGIAEYQVKKDEFLIFEDGPSQDFKLQWATYQDASDQCSLSRIWGGIHPPADDIPGRRIGTKVGKKAFSYGSRFFNDKQVN